MKRLGLALLLAIFALSCTMNVTLGESTRPTLGPPNRAPKKGSEKKTNENQTSLEQRIANNVPKDFPVPLKWPFYSSKLGNAVSLWFQPTTDFLIEASKTAPFEGHIFMQTDNNTLCAISLEGGLQWASDFSFRLINAPRVSTFGVYVNHLSRIVALDRRSGRIMWLQDYDMAICTPLHVTPNMIYAGTWNKLVVAINRINGQINWTYGLDGDIYAATCDTFSPIPADYILAPCLDGNLYAISSAGEELWRFATFGRLNSTPVTEIVTENERYVYFGSQDTNFYCVNAISSQKKWEYRSGASINESPILCGKYVYFRPVNGEMHCLAKEDGTLKWKKAGATSIVGTTASGEIYLLYGTNTIAAVNPETGAERWKFELPGFAKFTPNTKNGVIYGMTKDGLILTFEETMK